MIRVVGLATTPVKGMRLQQVDRIELLRSGARGNRRFFVIDERNRMVNGKIFGELQTVAAQCADGRLRLTFRGGEAVEAEIAHAESVTARFFSLDRTVPVLDGPWAQALSERLGAPVRIVEAEGSIDRGAVGAASLISRASLARLAEAGDVPGVDVRRFRMLIEVDGVDAHEEDRWVGRTAQIGGAAVTWRGHVGRCMVTSRDPETGIVDLPTLDILRAYRGALATTEPLPFGIHGEVVREGIVAVGDELTLG